MIYQIKPVIGNKAKKSLINYIKRDNWITEHKVTENFEKKFSKFTNSKYCICFPNGTITMSSILDCLDLKKNNEVLVSNYTMVATANVVKFANLKLKLVDISNTNLCMCPKDLLKKINKNTLAIFITHAMGFNGLTENLLDVLNNKRIPLIEDVCESHGATFKGAKLGSFGLMSNFSFYFSSIKFHYLVKNEAIL